MAGLFFTLLINDFCPSIYMQAIKHWVKKNFSGWIYRKQKDAAKKQAMLNHLKQFDGKSVSKLSDLSFDIFTYHGEDGIIFYLLQKMKDVPPFFVDIGAGDCIRGNCTGLAIHAGWGGVFVDRDKKKLSAGLSFYKKDISAGANIKFLAAEVTPENVNEIAGKTGVSREIGLLSIDIDGNDFWIWKAIQVIQPRIVVVEAKVEFGHRNVIVPYGPQNHHTADKEYNGASIEAFCRLGAQKGYKLIGANSLGYNLFFVRNDEDLPAATTGDVLTHPGTIGSFYPGSFFLEHKFVTV